MKEFGSLPRFSSCVGWFLWDEVGVPYYYDMSLHDRVIASFRISLNYLGGISLQGIIMLLGGKITCKKVRYTRGL